MTSQGPAWATPSIPQPSISMAGVPAPATTATGNPMNTVSTSPTTAISDEAVMNILLQPYSTLDEPVLETIMRDVRAVATKLKIVMLPLDKNGLAPFGYMGVIQNDTSNNTNNDTNQTTQATQATQQDGQLELGTNQKKVIDELKNWDLWGPLIVCLALSVLLSFKAPTNQAALVFASVFCLVWIGSAIVTINAQLLGGTISFFQSVCVLGYCVFPMTVSAFIIGLMRLTPLSFLWVDMIFLALGFMWAIRASSVFIASYIKRERQLLAVYPVFFFYVFLGWLILLF